jgi:hypothetical protein
VESRREPDVRKRRRVVKETTRPGPASTSWDLPNITHLIQYGDITVGRLRPVGCVATAADEDQSLAMLVRRPGETLLQLLTRLDQAIEKAYEEGVPTDEINPPPKQL